MKFIFIVYFFNLVDADILLYEFGQT